MSTLRELQQQLSKLQQELKELREHVLNRPQSRPWWEQIAGSAAGRPLFDAVAREGRKIRQEERERARTDKRRKPPRSPRPSV